jgi:hypothetical protein
MAHITLSIPDELHKEMKKYKEIRWSAAARRGIQQELLRIQDKIAGKDWFRSLSPDLQKNIEQIAQLSKKDWTVWHKKTRTKDKKRV